MNKKKSLKTAFKLLLAVAGALLFISLFGRINFTVEALQFQVSTQLYEQGVTEVKIPPLGQIRANTHRTPVKITARLENIDLQALKSFITDSPEQKEIETRARAEIAKTMKLFVIKILILSCLGGAFGSFLLSGRKASSLLKGAAVGFAAAFIFISCTYSTYNSEKFKNPEYEGIFQAAPQMVNFAEEALGKIETLSEKMQVIATNLYSLFDQIDRLEPLENSRNDLTVLHISDLHNNPAGMNFAVKIAHLFNAGIIIDTGDISDFGTPLETLLMDYLEELEVPYLFIPGNHDSPDIIEHLNEIPGVTVVNGLLEVKGLKIAGFPDPASANNTVTPPDIDAIQNNVKSIKENLAELDRETDLLAVHNNTIAERLAGKAPVILYGHNHNLSVKEKYNSIMVNAGTTGASGIRGVQSLNSPYSVALLHFKIVDDKMTLAAVDAITIKNIQHGFIMERKVFNREEDNSEEQQDTENNEEAFLP